MKNYLKFILKISRPRFWLYLAGPYLVGYAAGVNSLDDFISLKFAVYFLYFLIIANIFLYGINDYFDNDTDQYNDKKITHEHLLQISERKKLTRSVLVCFFASLVLFLNTNITVQILLFIFLFLSFFYSAPPLRFKSKPVVDFASNILYGIPALVGYAQLSGKIISWPIILAIFFWTSAMHLFSAIPDIDSDKKAGLKTTAVVFGFRVSTVICFVFWTASFLLVSKYTILSPWSILGLIYPLLAGFVLLYPEKISKIYWFFPIINALFGFMLFFKTVFLK